MNNENESSVKTKNITVGLILGWILGVIFAITGVVMIFSKPISGLLFLIASAILLPPVNRFIKNKYNFSLSRNVKILAVLILLVIGSIAGGKSDSEKVASDVNNTSTPPPTAQSTTTPTQPAQPIPLDQQITQKINEVLGPTNNTNKPTVVKVEIEKYKPVELTDYKYKSTDDIKGIFIVINSSENLTTNLQKGTMDDEASKIFQNIFPLSSQIGDIIIWEQLPVKDQYGNTKDDTAIVFSMGRPLFLKVNWSNFNHRDLPILLNSERSVDDRNNYFESIKF